MRLLATFALAALVTLAGCIAPTATDDPLYDPPVSGEPGMTGEETTTADSKLCGDRLPVGGSAAFCATRTITVTGTLVGFRALDVDLATFNGDVVVKEGKAGAWGMVATLEARGATAAEAEANVAKIEFEWAHVVNGVHLVAAEASYDGRANDVSAGIELTMPRGLVMSIVAGTSNGDVVFEGGLTDGLALETSNGDVVAKGSATQVSLSTSNGDVDAELRPTSSGSWTLSTSNGDTILKVPEGPGFGYDIEGRTSNGEVEYSLRDGEKGPCPEGSEYYTPPCNERTFTTTGFSKRLAKVAVELSTSNGEVSVSPL